MNGMAPVATFADGVLGWLVVGGGAIVTAWVIVLSVRWAVWPGEADPSHPKNLVLRDDR